MRFCAKLCFLAILTFSFSADLSESGWFTKDEVSGYESLNWGASINEVKNTFGGLTSDKILYGAVRYKQFQLKNDTIKSRYFTFRKEKLVEVYNHLSLDQETWKLALEKLNNKFGKYDDIERKFEKLDDKHRSEITSYFWNMKNTYIRYRKVRTPMPEYKMVVTFYDITYRDMSYVRFLADALNKKRVQIQENIDL